MAGSTELPPGTLDLPIRLAEAIAIARHATPEEG